MFSVSSLLACSACCSVELGSGFWVVHRVLVFFSLSLFLPEERVSFCLEPNPCNTLFNKLVSISSSNSSINSCFVCHDSASDFMSDLISEDDGNLLRAQGTKFKLNI